MYVYEAEFLEYRQRGRRLAGTFRYGTFATVKDRGRTRKETIRSRAFSFAIKSEEHDIDLLRGHSFDSPLGSKLSGTLALTESDEALEFVASLPPDRSQPSWMVDTVLAVRSGLVRGISPGFRRTPVVRRRQRRGTDTRSRQYRRPGPHHQRSGLVRTFLSHPARIHRDRD